MENILAKLSRGGLSVQATALGLIVILAGALAAPVAWGVGGRMGLAASGIAGGACLIGALVALAVGHLLRGPELALSGLLLGMIIRMGIPLALALACQLRGGPLSDAGVLYYLLWFYPLTLAAGTVLSLPRPKQTPATATIPVVIE